MSAERKNYDKLIRDHIPEIIKKAGKNCETRRVKDRTERKRYLIEKLREEVHEYIESGKKDELADILEVIHCLTEIEGSNFAIIDKMRLKKKEDRGGFDRGIVLEWVE